MNWIKSFIDKIFLIREIRSQKGELHFKRWRLIACPWFNVYIHLIAKADQDKHMHDHPWSFMSLIIHGGFAEQTIDGTKIRRPGSISFNKAEKIHKITHLATLTRTFVITGPRKRDWGYRLKNNTWINNELYRELKNSGKLEEEKVIEDHVQEISELQIEIKLLESLPYTHAYTGDLSKLKIKSYVELDVVINMLNEKRRKLKEMKKD